MAKKIICNRCYKKVTIDNCWVCIEGTSEPIDDTSELRVRHICKSCWNSRIKNIGPNEMDAN